MNNNLVSLILYNPTRAIFDFGMEGFSITLVINPLLSISAIPISEIPTILTADQTAVNNDKASSDLLPSEPLAYSVELKKTFTLDAFNKLTKEELMTFSGIGEVTAQAILNYRRDNGPFAQFEDLMLVKGIGEKKLQKIMSILP